MDKEFEQAEVMAFPETAEGNLYPENVTYPQTVEELLDDIKVCAEQGIPEVSIKLHFRQRTFGKV